MATRLTHPMRREIHIAGNPHTLVLTETGVTITPKRSRSGVTHSWDYLANLSPIESRGTRAAEGETEGAGNG